MRNSTLVLSTLLALSAAANYYFYAQLALHTQRQATDAPTASNQSQASALNTPAALAYQQGEAAFEANNAAEAVSALEQLLQVAPEQAAELQRLWFQHIVQAIANHDRSYWEFVQHYLRHFPLDPYFLYLEIELQQHQSTPADTLFALYQLRHNAIPVELENRLLNRIKSVYSALAARLKNNGEYDVLASTIESLSPFASQHPVLLLDLAEAYAAQSKWGLLDGVLAALPSNDARTVALKNARYRARHGKRYHPSHRDGFDNGDRRTLKAAEIPQRHSTLSAVPLQRRGEHFLVTAHLDKHYPVELLLDTGASSSVISKRVFIELSSSMSPIFVGDHPVSTANGTVTAPVYRFRELSIGEHGIADITIVVLPLEQLPADGLLGMDFLHAFQFDIDQRQALLKLAPH